MKNMLKLSVIIIALVLNISCNEESIEENQKPLELTAENIEGEWTRIGIYKSTDPSGKNLPNENLMDSIDDCRKDDIIKYTISPDSPNIRYWVYNNDICEGQEKNKFIELGTWILDSKGKLYYYYSDVQESYKIIELNRTDLLIRKSSGIKENDEINYYFEKYERQI